MGRTRETGSRIADAMDRIRLTDSERFAANAAMQQGERIATLILAACAVFGSVVHGVERGIRSLTRHKSVS